MAKQRNSKRIVVITDTHCGHRGGLTPPGAQSPDDEGELDGTSAKKRAWFGKVQRICWDWYVKKIAGLRPIDCVVHLGDAIEGDGRRSKGVELIAADINEQIDMAEAVCRQARAKKYVFVNGTWYHTEDFEQQIANRFPGAKIGDHEWLDVNGVTFDLKHFVGGGQTPYTRMTAPKKDDLWNLVWADRGEQPRADILLRGHVHYHEYMGGYRGGKRWLVATAPALQGFGTIYGARQCSGTIDYGFLWFDIVNEREWSWQSEILYAEHQRAVALKL